MLRWNGPAIGAHANIEQKKKNDTSTAIIKHFIIKMILRCVECYESLSIILYLCIDTLCVVGWTFETGLVLNLYRWIYIYSVFYFNKNAQKKRNDFHNLWIFLFYFKWSLCIWMGYCCGRRCRSIKPSTTLHNLCLINTFGLRFFIYWCRLFILFCIHFCDIVVIAFASSFVFFSTSIDRMWAHTLSWVYTVHSIFKSNTNLSVELECRWNGAESVIPVSFPLLYLY